METGPMPHYKNTVMVFFATGVSRCSPARDPVCADCTAELKAHFRFPAYTRERGREGTFKTGASRITANAIPVPSSTYTACRCQLHLHISSAALARPLPSISRARKGAINQKVASTGISQVWFLFEDYYTLLSRNTKPDGSPVASLWRTGCVRVPRDEHTRVQIAQMFHFTLKIPSPISVLKGVRACSKNFNLGWNHSLLKYSP
jgi:hypothetical protein